MALKPLETATIVVGIAFAGYIVYQLLIPKEDEGTLVLEIATLPVPPEELDERTYCDIDGQPVATSLLIQTGIALKAGVHTFAMHADVEGTGQFQMVVQSQFQIQPKIRTRLNLRVQDETIVVDETFE